MLCTMRWASFRVFDDSFNKSDGDYCGRWCQARTKVWEIQWIKNLLIITLTILVRVHRHISMQRCATVPICQQQQQQKWILNKTGCGMNHYRDYIFRNFGHAFAFPRDCTKEKSQRNSAPAIINYKIKVLNLSYYPLLLCFFFSVFCFLLCDECKSKRTKMKLSKIVCASRSIVDLPRLCGQDKNPHSRRQGLCMGCAWACGYWELFIGNAI